MQINAFLLSMTSIMRNELSYHRPIKQNLWYKCVICNGDQSGVSPIFAHTFTVVLSFRPLLLTVHHSPHERWTELSSHCLLYAQSHKLNEHKRVVLPELFSCPSSQATYMLV